MAKIRHIAMTSDNPSKLADFYKEVFGMTEVRRSENGQVFLTDGYINMALLNYKTPNDEDPGPNGGYYDGIHHIGFQVDDIEAAAEKLDKAGGARLSPHSHPRHRRALRLRPRPEQCRDQVHWPRRRGAGHVPVRLGDRSQDVASQSLCATGLKEAVPGPKAL